MAKLDRVTTLTIHTRAKTGTTAATALRRAGKIPAVLFGHGSPPVAVEVDARSFDELLQSLSDKAATFK